MNKAEFIQTLSGYVPEKLIDALAENAEWDGLFYEESGNAVDEKVPDYEFAIPFMTSDIGGVGHRRKKAERTFKGLRAIVKNHLNDFSGTDKTKRPHSAVEYAERELPKFPDKVSDQTIVDIQQLYKAVGNIPPALFNRTISNLKLSELIYLFADKNEVTP